MRPARLLPALLLLSTAVFALSPRADAAETAFYVSTFSREHCAHLHNVITLARHDASQVECVNGALAIEATRASGRYAYYIQSERNPDGSLRLRVENWSRQPGDEADFEAADWKVAKGTEAEQNQNEQRLLERFFDYDKHKRVIRELALVHGIPESKKVKLDPDSGEYVDVATGRDLPFEGAWRLYQGESPRLRDYLRAAVELAVVLGAGTGWYWGNGDLNSADWEYENKWADWRKKLAPPFDGVRFDNNYHYTNALYHPFTGALMYLFARNNRLSILESFLFTFAASSIWEYVIEYREKVSLNDVIVTPVAGMVIGEVFAQLGAFFERGADTIVNRVLSAIFGGPRALHNWMDGNKIRRGGTDSLGFTTDMWHQIDIWAAVSYTQVDQPTGSSSRVDAQVGLETQLINVPGYGQPGEVSRLLSDGNFSQLIVKATLGEQGLLDFLFFAKVALAGYFKQSIERGETGALKGYSFFIGAAAAFEYNQHAQPNTETDDKVGVVNVLGSTVDLAIFVHGVKIRAVIDVFGDFAMVRSYAVDTWFRSQPQSGIKSVLSGQRYYYALGVTTQARITAQYQQFEIGGELKFDYFDSIEGMDRYQERIVNDFGLSDRRLGYRVWLSYTLPGDHVKLAFAMERLWRQGEIENLSVERDELRFLGNLIVLF